MPNHCYTHLNVVGDVDEMRDFTSVALECESSNKGFIPTLVPLPEDGDLGQQYDLWGTKWGDIDLYVCDHGVEDGNQLLDASDRRVDEHGYATLEYWTPWNPATAAMSTISRMFPSCLFEASYIDEMGCFYAGGIYQDGQYLEISRQYSDDDWERINEDPSYQYELLDTLVSDMVTEWAKGVRGPN